MNKYETIESKKSSPVTIAAQHMIRLESNVVMESVPMEAGRYHVSYSYVTRRLTYEWVLNHPTGKEEHEVFV